MQLHELIKAMEDWSADAASSINEDNNVDERQVSNSVNRMRRRMKQGSYLALKDGIDDLENLGLHDDRMAVALEAAKADILAWLDKSLGHAYTDRLVNQMLMLIDIGISWPEITTLLESHKDAVVKSMLQRISQHSGDAIDLLHLRGYIERFSKMGIRWSELRAMWKSIASTLRDRDLDEGKSSKRVPKVIRKEVDEFIAACEKGNWLKAMERLFWIGGYSVLPIEAERLEPYKNSLIKGLLAEFKECSGDDEDGIIGDAISGLKEMGADWPELDIIKRSLTTTSSVDLDEASDKPSWYMDITEMLTQGNIHLQGAKHHKDAKEPRQIDEMFISDLKKTDASELREIIRCLANGDYEAAMTWMCEMGIGPRNIPVVVSDKRRGIIEQHKAGIVKMMLMVMKAPGEFGFDDDLDSEMIVRAAERLGLNWPEIKIMRRSIDASSKLDEDDDYDDRRREMQQDADDDYERPNVGDELIRILQSSKDASGLDRAFVDLDHMGVDHQTILSAAEDNVDYITSWFIDVVDDSNVESIMDCLGLMDDWFNVSDLHMKKDLHDAIDHRREEFIPWLLKRMKSGRERGHNIKILKALVDWSELDTMQRSLDADKTSRPNYMIGESTNLLPKKIQSIVDRDIALIRTRGSNFIRTLQWDLRDAGVSPSTIDDIFNMNKAVILHALNADMEHRDPRTALSIIVSVMDSMNWPEIKTMVDARMEDMRIYVLNLVKTYHFGHAAHTMDYIKSLNVAKESFVSVRKDVINAIVDSIKRIIKSYGFDRSVMDGLDALNQMGTKVDLGSGAIKEKLLSDFEADLKRFGLSTSFGNDVGRYVKLIIKHGNQETVSAMKELIEANKVPVVRNMLQTIKTNAFGVYPTLTMLQHLGFKWRELDTINKSLKSGGLTP